MLKKMHMQEIQDLKLRGYSMNEIIHYFEERGRKPPSLPILRKYFKMEALPEVPNQNLIKYLIVQQSGTFKRNAWHKSADVITQKIIVCKRSLNKNTL